MLSVIILVYLLLPALADGSTVQQDLLCTDSYAEFESASFALNNVSGNNLRNRLYEVFYAPNQHLPYSVIVNYQLVLANGKRLNLSSEQDCSNELWVWVSSPVFLVGGTSYINRYLLFTLNYFMDWNAPRVTITTTIAPCPASMRDVLSEMTASLEDYALGQMEHKTNLGYVRRGCGTSIGRTTFHAVGEARVAALAVYIIMLNGIFFQVVFVWIVSAVLLRMTFKEYAQKTFTYSYDMYGMFWGASTTALGLFGILNVDYAATNHKYGYADWKAQCFSAVVLLSTVALELPVAIYTARKATVAVPCIFKYPAALLCCGRRRPAECLVTTMALWVNLVVLQLILFHATLVVFVISAAPFAVVTNVMVVVLALSCLLNIFSLIYTIFAHVCTPSDQRVHSSSMVLRAVVVLPLLLMIMCHGVVFASTGLVTNVDAKRSNTLSSITSTTTPVLLGVISIFLKRFISVWLKWTPKGTEQANDTSHGQGVAEELLDP